MAELKTKQNDADVGAFLDGVENEKRREDCRAVVELMADVTGEPANWPDVEPIGRQFRPRFQPGAAPWIPVGRSDWFTVVGVVGDFRENRIDEPVVPTVYLSQRQNPSRLMSLVVGTRGAATGVARAIQREIRAVVRADPMRVLHAE